MKKSVGLIGLLLFGAVCLFTASTAVAEWGCWTCGYKNAFTLSTECKSVGQNEWGDGQWCVNRRAGFESECHLDKSDGPCFNIVVTIPVPPPGGGPGSGGGGGGGWAGGGGIIGNPLCTVSGYGYCPLNCDTCTVVALK